MLKTHITNVYGETTYKQTTKLQQMKRKAASTKCRWVFMSKCVTHNVLPKSFQTRPVLRTRKGYMLTKEYNKKMLQLTRNETKKQYHKYLKEIKTKEEELQTQMNADDFNVIHNKTDTSRENKFIKERKRLKEKFETLQSKNDTGKDKKKIQREVYDLTKDGITEDVKTYLRLGPDFSETPNRIPYEKIIIETENMCRIIEMEREKEEDAQKANELEREIHTLRERVKKLLSRFKGRKMRSNLTSQEFKGKKEAYRDKDRVYLPADKGRVMVAMDKTIEIGGESSYDYKMKKVLEDMKAQPSIRAEEDWDVTEKVSREGRKIIQEMVDNEEITEAYGRYLKPSDCRAPRLTGYPKIHKEGVPLRGVVSFIGSPYQNVAKALVPILRSLQGRSGHYIKNSRELKESVKEWTVKRDEILVSYDVEKLYPSIPINKALELIDCLLKCKPNLKEVTSFSIKSIMKLLRWIFSLTYCEYNNTHYILDCGPIGLSVVGEVAIIYMEDFQMRAKHENFPELNEWPWYVDDSVLKCTKEKAETILNHLNNIEPDSIKFTKEEEENNMLPVLDLELNVNRKTKKIEFNVHYKKTNTNVTIKKKSNHKESVKKGIIKGYGDRARALCDPQHLKSELTNIEEVFVENGFTRKEVRNAMRPKRPPDETTAVEEEEETNRGMVLMPNIPEFTTKFNNIAQKHKFKTANKANNKVRDLTANAKTPLGDKNSKVVYNIPCKCEENAYTGETDRMWKTRQKEHESKVRLTKRDIENGDLERATERMNTGDGGLAKHSTECEKGIDWEHAKIVGKENNKMKRKMLEGVETVKQKCRGKKPLNAFNQMIHWQSTIYSFLGNN